MSNQSLKDPSMIEQKTETNTNATQKSGWVSSTGGASPWYGSSHHRASISGPYYRTRGMSVTRDNENDEDLSHIISTHSPTHTNTALNTNQHQQHPSHHNNNNTSHGKKKKLKIEIIQL
ncbi:uncharacterized protein BX663DRAFT_433759 [Cokeromyces recurvatus]|uniref:uncharacterized protein n=1 Tax=Cokeromyces recurvatus TaxID=90255 RepID=UPI00221F08A8|nr:uncharacterized protein BX663DRAFT_433759 [Cokeromyces recurvatus]KAI7903381.1 hypothetical protein BX663DRAFT_433759 [Cokeromyces recurvatus]